VGIIEAMIERNHSKRSRLFVIGFAAVALSLQYPGLALAKKSSDKNNASNTSKTSSTQVIKVDAGRKQSPLGVHD
jgi:hypothetical protein